MAYFVFLVVMTLWCNNGESGIGFIEFQLIRAWPPGDKLSRGLGCLAHHGEEERRGRLPQSFCNCADGAILMGPPRPERRRPVGLSVPAASSVIRQGFCRIPIASAIQCQEKPNPHPKSHFIYFR